MQITFTLNSAYTGATYVAGPFNISGTTCEGSTYQLATGVTKSQLISGHPINTVYETLTGGTITSTGTCGTSQPWYTGVNCPSSGVTLQVYGRDLATVKDVQSVYYYVNSGSSGQVTLTNRKLPALCGLIGTITGLTNGDTVTFGTVSSVAINGSDNGGDCPNISAANYEYTTTIAVASGNAYCSLSIESGYTA